MKDFVQELGINWRKHLLYLVFIILVAASLRIYKLTYLPIFGDEAIYIRWAQVMRADPGNRFLPLSDGKQPLFMWSVIPFLKTISDPLVAGRIVSVLTGLGTLIGIFALVYILFNGPERDNSKSERKGLIKASIISALVFAISPYSVFFDRLALVDSMLSFFGVFSFIFAILTVKYRRLDFSMIAGFFLGGALLTKSPAIFISLLIPLTWILTDWPKKLSSKVIQLIKLGFLFFPTYFIGYGMYNILRLGSNFHMIGLRNKDYIFPYSHILERPLDPLIPFLDRTLEWMWILGPSVILIMAVGALMLNGLKYKKQYLLLLGLIFIPLTISAEFAKVFTARYVLFLFPYFTILTGSLFLRKRYKKLSILLLAVFTIHSFWINKLLLTDVENAPLPQSERSGYLEEWTSGTGIKEVADYLRTEYQSNPDDKIVVGTEGYFGTLPDGLQVYLNDIPEITVVGIGIDIKEIPNSLSESKKAGNKTYLVINNSRLKADYEKLGLNLVASYPKAKRSKDTHEISLYGPQEVLYFFEVTEASIKSL